MLDQPVPNPVAKNPNIYTHKVFASVGLILIGTIVAIAGIWWYTQNQANSEPEDTSVKVSTTSAKPSTSSATKDETADWLIYNDGKYSVKYPAGWVASLSNLTKPSSILVVNDSQVVQIRFGNDLITGPNVGPGTNANSLGEKIILVDGVKLNFVEQTRKDNGKWYFASFKTPLYVEAYSPFEPDKETKRIVEKIISTIDTL